MPHCCSTSVARRPTQSIQPVLDPQMILAHVSGLAGVFREFAAAHSLTTVASVFPHSQEDIFLRFLEGQPWTNGPIHEPSSAGRWSSRTTTPILKLCSLPMWRCFPARGLPKDAPVKSPMQRFSLRRNYCSSLRRSEGSRSIPVLAQLDAHGTLVLEADGMVRMPTPRPHDYSKGVVLESVDDHHVHISELFAEHPDHDSQDLVLTSVTPTGVAAASSNVRPVR